MDVELEQRLDFSWQYVPVMESLDLREVRAEDGDRVFDFEDIEDRIGELSRKVMPVHGYLADSVGEPALKYIAMMARSVFIEMTNEESENVARLYWETLGEPKWDFGDNLSHIGNVLDKFSYVSALYMNNGGGYVREDLIDLALEGNVPESVPGEIVSFLVEVHLRNKGCKKEGDYWTFSSNK